MEALMLVADQADLLPHFRAVLQARFPAATIADLADQTGFVIEFSPQTRAYVEYFGDNLEQIGWDEQEIAFITSLLPTSHHVYSIRYRGVEAGKQVIISLADSPKMVVDNDCGTLLKGDDFVRKVLAEPEWYWFDDL